MDLLAPKAIKYWPPRGGHINARYKFEDGMH